VSAKPPRTAFPVPALTRRPEPADSVALLGVGGLAALALAFALLAFGHSAIAAAIPAAFLGTLIAVRWPHLAIGGLLATIGFELPLTAFFHLHVAGMVDGAILVLWIASAWTIVHNREQRPVWLWPGLVALCLYPLVSLPAIFTADTTALGFASWKLSSWHLLAFAALAVAPWPPGTYRRIAKTIVLVALAAAAYSLFVRFAGASASELAVARANIPGLPRHLPVPFFGSFFRDEDLATWGSVMIPTTTAFALAWRGPWRLLAILAACGSTFGLLEADRRAAFVGAVAGVLVVLLLFSMSARAFGGRRLAITLIALGATLAIGAGIYGVTVARSPESAARFEGLLSPTQEKTFQIRQSRWDVAIQSADRHPLGVGLGHVGAVLQDRTSFSGEEIINLDSAYLKIAYEQGFPVLVLFVFGLITLFVSMAIGVTRTASQQRAMLGIAACGTLAAMATVFYAIFFIESLPAVAGWVVIGVGAGQFCKAPVVARAGSRVPPPRLVRGVPRLGDNAQ
jgi:hypothetical protein